VISRFQAFAFNHFKWVNSRRYAWVNGAVLKLQGPLNAAGAHSCGLVPEAYVGDHGGAVHVRDPVDP
jgi:hypothetical protein